MFPGYGGQDLDFVAGGLLRGMESDMRRTMSDGGSEGDEGEGSEEGPTFQNPWGRDGDLLHGGLGTFTALVDKQRAASGQSYVDAFAMRDEDGFNAVHHCAFQGYDEILAFIIANSGAGLAGLLCAPILTGEAALHLAVQYKREGCIELLLKAGAGASARDKYGQTVLDYVSQPSKCRGPTYMIEGDLDFRTRMKTRLHHALWLQTAKQLRTIRGLTSEAGQQLNGRVCEEMSLDSPTGRYVVRLSHSDPPSQWKKIRPENLEPAGASAQAGGAAIAADRCRTCWTTAEERTRLALVMPFLMSTSPLDACPSCGRLPSPRGPPPAG